MSDCFGWGRRASEDVAGGRGGAPVRGSGWGSWQDAGTAGNREVDGGGESCWTQVIRGAVVASKTAKHRLARMRRRHVTRPPTAAGAAGRPSAVHLCTWYSVFAVPGLHVLLACSTGSISRASAGRAWTPQGPVEHGLCLFRTCSQGRLLEREGPMGWQ